MDGWWWVWAEQTTRRVTLGAGGLSRGLRGIPARHRISCSVSCPPPLLLFACKRVLSHPPPTTHIALLWLCCTVSLVGLPPGYSATHLPPLGALISPPTLQMWGCPLPSSLLLRPQLNNSTFLSIAVDYQPNVRAAV